MLINSEQARQEQQKLLSDISEACNVLKPYAPQKDLEKLEQERYTFQEKASKLYKDSRKLNIGVIGQIKAGKSSFLNTLLFNGQEILPKAATPKTATLTKIEFGEQNVAEIEYYTPEEWEKQEQAAKGADSDVAKAARELVKMAEDKRLDIKRWLEEGPERLEFDSYQDMIGKLNEYVGENGLYTPLVKSVCLQISDERFSNELFSGCSIVDTPGLNDPVVSRTQRTKEFIDLCDVVFLLSVSDHFLDASDWKLLSSQLPQGGVKKLVLIGSKYDSVVRDTLKKKSNRPTPSPSRFLHRVSSHTDSVPDACQMVLEKLSQQAETKVQKAQEDLRDLGFGERLLQAFESCKNPIFFSSLACNMLNKSECDYTEEEASLFKKLTGFSQDVQADLARMGNIAPVREILHEIILKKENILREQADSLVVDTKRKLRLDLDELQKGANNTITALKTGSSEQLMEQQRKLQEKQAQIKADISDVFSRRIDALKTEQKNAVASLRSAGASSAEIEQKISSKEVSHSYQVSTSKWYKPWTWGRKETRWYTTTETYSYLASSDAAESLTRYALTSSSQIEQVFLKSVQPQELRSDLREVVIKRMDLGAVDFNVDLFRQKINELVDGISFPTIQINTQDVVSKCISGFDSEVKDQADMQRLQSALQNGMTQLFNTLCTRFNQESTQFIDCLTQLSADFQKTLLEKLDNELKDLSQKLLQKEQEIKRLETYLQKLEESKTLLGVNQ